MFGVLFAVALLVVLIVGACFGEAVEWFAR
jgi:hypothetical protein